MASLQNFLSYYRCQLHPHLAGGEAEWRQLISALRRRLPVTFRTSQVTAHASRVRDAFAELKAEYVPAWPSTACVDYEYGGRQRQ